MTKATRVQSILNFHGIGVPHVGVPEEEKPYWVSEDRFAEIAREVALLRNEGFDVGITFDDGNLSDLAVAAPILLDLSIKAEFFVLTARLVQDFYLRPADVRALLDLGMDIGLHGQDHVDWRWLDDAGLKVETRSARHQLEDVTGRSVSSVAIPFGAYNRRVIAHLRGEKFKAIYTSDGGPTSSSMRVRARTSVRSDMTLNAINTIISDRPPIIERFRRAISTTLRRYVV